MILSYLEPESVSGGPEAGKWQKAVSSCNPGQGQENGLLTYPCSKRNQRKLQNSSTEDPFGKKFNVKYLDAEERKTKFWWSSLLSHLL